MTLPDQNQREFEKSLIWVRMHFPSESTLEQVKMAEAVHLCTKEIFDEVLPKMVGNYGEEVYAKCQARFLDLRERLN